MTVAGGRSRSARWPRPPPSPSSRNCCPRRRPAPSSAGKAGRLSALLLVGAGIAATLYRFAPSREDARWEWITPGSLFAAVTWLLLTSGFGIYVTAVADYGATYGSLGAVVALLTWMYLSAYVFLLGAELNSEIEHQTAKDSTTGAAEPLGERGAWAADHVARGDNADRIGRKRRAKHRLTRGRTDSPDAAR